MEQDRPTTTAPTAPISPAHFAAALEELTLPTLRLKLLEIRNSIAHLRVSNLQLLPFATGTETAVGGTPGEPDTDCVEAIRENEAVIDRMRERVDLIKAEVEGRGTGWREFAGDDAEDVQDAPLQTQAQGQAQNGEAEEGSREDKAVERGGAAARGGTTATATATATTVNGISSANGASVLRAIADEEDRIARGPGPSTGGGDAAPAATDSRHPAWADGTFQTGVIRGGDLVYDTVPGQSLGGAPAAPTGNNNNNNSTRSTGGGRLTDEQLRRAMEERLRGLGDDDNDDRNNDGGVHL